MEFGLLDKHLEEETSALISLCISSWYWWIYATNFLIYCATTRDFRTVYRLFSADVCIKLGAQSLAARILPDEERNVLV